LNKIHVLFVCIHNSGRSQMAEALLKAVGGESFEAESAGIEPGNLNPIVVEALKEIKIDISKNKTKAVCDLFKQGRLYKYVVTVCDESSAERCPIFPGVTKRLHWSFTDPASFDGSYAERLAKTRAVRDKIKVKIEAFISAEMANAKQ
jgi:arsenate reductase